ncbi:MAG: 4Fe-4S dicluster domain-containing protein [Candidatus Oleimicrobiaceae bacterium]
MRDIPREKIPWFPTVDYDACTGDQECFNFCKNEVFRWDEGSNRPVVENPYNCVLGCSACANICPAGAITFPSLEDIRQLIRKLREEAEAI